MMARLITFALLLCSSLAHAQSLVNDPDIKAIYAEAMKQRAKQGLPAQQLDESLCRLCADWSKHMAQTGRVEHSKPWRGENIVAWDSRPKAPVTECIAMWLGSKAGHREQVLGKTTKCGYAVARSKTGTYWTGAFSGTSGGGTGGDSTLPLWAQILRRILGL